MKKFDYKVAMVTSVLAFSGIGLLVQCAPKKSEAPSAGKQEKVQNISNLVEGIDFKSLESSKDTAAKAIYKALKEKSMPDSASINLAIAEQHLKAAGKQSDNQSAMKLTGEIMELTQKSKISKMEDLRKIYDTIDTAKNTKFKTGNREHNLDAVLEKAEVSVYSAPLLIATTWLSSSVGKTTAVAVISPGAIELGEVRAESKVVTFTPAEKGTLTKELGKLEEVVKKSRVIPLNLLMIHEALKSYATNQYEWADRVIQTAANELKYKVTGDMVVSTTVKADTSKIEESILLFGKTTELKDSEMARSAIPDIQTPNPPTSVPAASPTATTTKMPVPPEAAQPAKDPYKFKINGAEKSYAETKKLLNEAPRKQLLGVIKKYFTKETDKKQLYIEPLKSGFGSISIARVDKLDDAQIKGISALSSEVDKKIKDALELKKAKNIDAIYLVQIKQKEGVKLNFISDEENPADGPAPLSTDVLTIVLTIKPELAEFILKQAEGSNLELDNIVSIEIIKN